MEGRVMLVLTRRLGETIVIANDIRVTVLEVKGDRIRLGVSAPPDVVVDREEVHERRQQFTRPAEAGGELPRLLTAGSPRGFARLHGRT
jgi:carbon storage regulator